MTAVGSDLPGVRIGDRVAVFALAGAFAETVIAEGSGLFPLPDAVPFEAAAACLIGAATALHALVDRGRLAAGETLLVLGAGSGTGLAAVEIGKLLGARVIAAASTPEKRAVALARGADAAIDSAPPGLRDALRGAAPGGIDAAFDPVGGPAGEIVVRALAHRGRHLIVGFASGTPPLLAANVYLVKQAEAIGVLWGKARTMADQRGNVARVLAWLAEGRLSPPVAAIHPLERGAEAVLAASSRDAGGKHLIRVADLAAA